MYERKANKVKKSVASGHPTPLKLALKNLGRFSSPTASRAILRGKYQNSEKDKTLRSYNFMKIKIK